MFDRIWHFYLHRPYRLHIERYGDPSLPKLVLLHGLGANIEDWKHFVPLLSVSYHCIAIDLLGCGHSPKPQWSGYYPDDHISSLRRTLRNLKLDEYTLMGHSLGALLAARYAAHYPDHIKRVLLLSPPVYPEVAHIRNRLAKQRTGVLLAMYRSTRQSFMTPELIKRLAFILPPARNIKEDLETWQPALRTLEHCIETQTILEDIQDVHMPIDVWYGLLDEVVVPTNVRLLSSRQPRVRLHSYQGRHLLTRRYADGFAAWFLKQKY